MLRKLIMRYAAYSQHKWLMRLVMVAGVAGVYFLVPGLKQEVDKSVVLLVAADNKGMQEYLKGYGAWGPVVSMALMALQALIAPIPAFVLTFANAWIWGWLWGALISWTGALLGALLCFYLARWLGRPIVEGMVGTKSLDLTDRIFARYGKYAVLIARLIPLVSFDLISYAAGLTTMTLWEFLWATGLGQLPATIVYSVLGENITSGAKFGLMVFSGVAILLVLSVLLKKRVEAKMLNQHDG